MIEVIHEINGGIHLSSNLSSFFPKCPGENLASH
jgi:hypothetical protein